MAEYIKQQFRNDGTTTKQIKAATKSAVYVWSNTDLKYPIELAKSLNRSDLKIVSPYWLKDRRYLGLELTDIILDHYFIPDIQTYNYFKEALTRIRK